MKNIIGKLIETAATATLPNLPTQKYPSIDKRSVKYLQI